VLTKDKQSATYDQAMHFVNSGEFKKALRLLEQVTLGPNLEMAHAARTHKATCERRLKAVSVKLESAEDYYNYGIALINQRNLDGARENLFKALARNENADHVHYALALCYGLSKDIEEAAKHLGRAIEIAPRNRAAAKNDSDFEPVIAEPQIRALLYPERSQAE
jgi:tetratricopeptide (TPR) repeat protein